MIPQIITAILLIIPLAVMLVPSINFWFKFKGSSGSRRTGKKAKYKKLEFWLTILVMYIIFRQD